MYDSLFHFDAFHGMLIRKPEAFCEPATLPDIVRRILAMNEEQAKQYVAAAGERERHWGKYPTAFACLKCMDGRVHFPSMTGTAMGLVKPFRAVGGRFELWWPAFEKRMRNWIRNVEREHHVRCGIFVTYHYSASDIHLGCAGWKHDTAAARSHATRLARDLGHAYGDRVVPIVVGVETDRDLLTFHGPQGDVAGSNCVGISERDIRNRVLAAFPAMPREVAHDLAPFLVGNASHVAELGERPRAQQWLGHRERVIAVGHGFDYWINTANAAVIVNDVDPNLDAPLATAAHIIAENLREAPIDEEALLLASVPFRERGMEWNASVIRAQGLARFALECIRREEPMLHDSGRLHVLIGVTEEATKLLEPIEVA